MDSNLDIIFKYLDEVYGYKLREHVIFSINCEIRTKTFSNKINI